MTAKRAILSKSDLVIFTLDLKGDRRVASLSFLRCTRRQHLRGNRFQCFALFGSRFLVDVIVCKIPVAERFHHRLTLGALPPSRDGKSVEFHSSVSAFTNEKHLSAAAGHLGRLGTEPAGTGGVARTGFFELAGNFPWSFVFLFICGLKKRPKENQGRNERAGEEGCRFHRADCIASCVSGQCDLTLACQP